MRHIAAIVGLMVAFLFGGLPLPHVSGGTIETYSANPDTMGVTQHSWTDGTDDYAIVFGSHPQLSYRDEGPGGMQYEHRNFFKFALPDFTDRNVLGVKINFQTGQAVCYTNCTPPLRFFVDVRALYVEPSTGGAQQVFDGVLQGIPYLRGATDELVLQPSLQYDNIQLGPNAIADLNHHEGGWYAFGMKIDHVLDAQDQPVNQGSIVICNTSCVAPGPLPWSGGSPPLSPGPNPSPTISQPYITITSEVATVWPQHHNNARHTGNSASLAPNTGMNVWRASLCEGIPQTCPHTEYSPVAKDGYLYTVVGNANAVGHHIRALTYAGTQVANRDVPETNYLVGGALSLAVNAEMVVFAGHIGPVPGTATVRAFSPAPNLSPLWDIPIAGEITRVAPTLYGRYVFVGTEGGLTDLYGKLRLYEGRDTLKTLVWTFTPVQADIVTPVAIYKGVILVRATTKLYALPFLDPSGNGIIDTSEVKWTFDMGAWSGNKWSLALASGPAVRGGFVFIGSHLGSVYKIPISGAGAGVPIWTRSVGLEVRSTPAIVPAALPGGVDGVYVLAIPSGSPGSAKVAALSSITGSPVYERQYSNARTGRSSVSLADGKVFMWLGDNFRAWIVVLNNALSLELYRVEVGPLNDAQNYDGMTPAIADGRIFAGNGGLTAVSPPDPWGYIMSWAS